MRNVFPFLHIWIENNINNNNNSSRWRFKKFKGKQRYLSKIYEALKTFKIIAFGHFSQDNFKKGQAKGPLKLIKKFLVSKGCNITIIDEHMTSKNCSKCACVTDHQHMSDEDLQKKLSKALSNNIKEFFNSKITYL